MQSNKKKHFFFSNLSCVINSDSRLSLKQQSPLDLKAEWRRPKMLSYINLYLSLLNDVWDCTFKKDKSVTHTNFSNFWNFSTNYNRCIYIYGYNVAFMHLLWFSMSVLSSFSSSSFSIVYFLNENNYLYRIY